MTDEVAASGRAHGQAPGSIATGNSPDPTTRTVEALYREVDHLKELWTNDRFAAKTAIELFQARLDMQPWPIENKLAIESLKEVMLEKFKSVDIRFADNLLRAEENSRASKTAVDAAFASSGQAITKNEGNTNKQLDQIQANIVSNAKSQDDKINDLKDRITVMESLGRGMANQKTETQTGISSNVGVIGLGVAIIVAAVSYFNSNSQPAPIVLPAESVLAR